MAVDIEEELNGIEHDKPGEDVIHNISSAVEKLVDVFPAKVDSELMTITSSAYGKEIKEAIHDSLYKIYEAGHQPPEAQLPYPIYSSSESGAVIVNRLDEDDQPIGGQIFFKSIGDASSFLASHPENRYSVVLSNTVTTSLSNSSFRDIASLRLIEMPDHMTTISSYWCKGCTNLRSVHFSSFAPDSSLSISTYAFEGCTSLEYINLPDTVGSIYAEAFKNCTSLTEIDLKQGLSTIHQECFSGCSSLTRIKIPEGVTKTEANCFKGCTSLTVAEIPNSMVTMASNTFANCTSLERIIIDKVEGSITGSNWGAPSTAEVIWLREEE